MWTRSKAGALLAAILAGLLGGCVSPPNPAEFFQPVSQQQQQIKSRMFDTAQESDLLRVCANVLMDNGFQVREADSRLAWIAAGKGRVLPDQPPVFVGATVLVYPAASAPGKSIVRLNLHGTGIRTGMGGPTFYSVSVEDADIYQQLFSKISQVLFMKAQPL
jgi:hypothetical protein